MYCTIASLCNPRREVLLFPILQIRRQRPREDRTLAEGHTGGDSIMKPLLFVPCVTAVIVLHREKTQRLGGGLCSVQTRRHCLVPADQFQASSCFHSVCTCTGPCARTCRTRQVLSFPLQVCDGPTPCRPPDLPLPPCRAPCRPSPRSQVPAACPPRLSLSWDPGVSHPCLQSPPGFLQSHSHPQTLSSAKTLTMSNPPGGEDGPK